MFLEKLSTRRTMRGSITILILALLWLSFLTFPRPQIIDIDTSWQLVLAHAFQQHWQAGVDYVFNYGPLGYFSLKEPNYDANLFYATVICWMITSFSLSVVFLTGGHLLPNRLEQSLYFVLLIVILPTISPNNDSWFLLGITAATILLLQLPPWLISPPRYFTALGITLLIFATLALTKFYLLIFIAVCVVSLVIFWWQRYSFLRATLLFLAFLLMFLGDWILYQQSLWNLPSFLVNSWEMASHHNETMSLKPDSTAVWLAILAIGLTSLMVALSCLTKPRELAKFLMGGILLGSLFLGWKASFVRYDSYHFLTFFNVVMLLPFWLPRTSIGGTIRAFLFSSLLSINVLVAMLGTFYLAGPYGYTLGNFISWWYETRIARHITLLWSLDDYKNACDQTMQQWQQPYDLPNIRATVGTATVDIFPPAQGIVLHNSLNYHPRPVFQGYVAYTESLLDLNRNFYANPATAPKFVILNLNAIDNRFPTMEDSKIFNLILRDYQPLFMEKRLLLLGHKPRALKIADQPLLTKVVNLGEKVELRQFQAHRLFLNLDIQYSFLGKLSTFLFQPPTIMLELETTDGTFLTYRLIPSISNSPFLLNPLLLTQTDSLNWYLGKPLKQATTLRIMAESKESQAFFEPTVTVKITDGGISPYPLAEDTKHQVQEDLLLFAVGTLPDFISVPSEVVTENGQAVLVIDSPGEIRFKRPKGSYHFSGQFGILPSIYNNLVNYQPATVGVEFSLLVVDSHGQEHLLTQKLLQPLKVPDDKVIQPFEGKINFPEEHSEVVLRTRALPTNNPLGKAAFWSDIQIKPDS